MPALSRSFGFCASLFPLRMVHNSVLIGVCAEGIVRGHKSGLLSAADYNNLCQCETLDDIKLNLVREVIESRAPASRPSLAVSWFVLPTLV